MNNAARNYFKEYVIELGHAGKEASAVVAPALTERSR